MVILYNTASGISYAAQNVIFVDGSDYIPSTAVTGGAVHWRGLTANTGTFQVGNDGDSLTTDDIYKEGVSKQKVGTRAFAQAVISNLGKMPTHLAAVHYDKNVKIQLPKYQRKKSADKTLIGVDLFVQWNGTNPDELAALMQGLNNAHLQLTMITNRGIKVWPDGFDETFCTDHWRCRFKPLTKDTMSKQDIIDLLSRADASGIDTIKTENLYAFDGKPAFSLGQGQ